MHRRHLKHSLTVAGESCAVRMQRAALGVLMLCYSILLLALFMELVCRLGSQFSTERTVRHDIIPSLLVIAEGRSWPR